MKIADLRIQSTTPSAPATNVVGIYANANGVLTSINSAGVLSQVGTTYTGFSATTVVQTGVSTAHTGIVIGRGPNTYVLGTPEVFLPVTINGSGLLIPAYSVKNT